MGYLELPRGTLATPDISYDYFPFTFSARASVLNNINNNNMKYIRELSPNKSGKKKSSQVNKSSKKIQFYAAISTFLCQVPHSCSKG